MATFNCGTILFCFFMIFHTINIVQTTQKEDDFAECLLQISYAFKSIASTDCFKHAMKYYKKDEYIPGNLEQSRLLADLQKNVHVSDAGMYSEQKDLQKNVYVSDTGMYSGQKDIQKNFHVSDTGMHSGQKGFDEQIIYSGQEHTNLEDISINVNSFDGLQDFIQKDLQTKDIFSGKKRMNYDLQTKDMFSGEKRMNYGKDPLPNFDSFADLQALVEAEKFINYQGISDNSSGQKVHHRLPPNFAMAYYKDMKNLVQGSNVIPAIPYCYKVFGGNPNCIRALSIFGDDLKSSKIAVSVALTDIKLSECENQFIRGYMEFLIKNIKIISPSKGANKFCREIYDDKPWYLELKQNIQISKHYT